MNHQDWNHIKFNTLSINNSKEQHKKIHSNKTTNPEHYILEAPANLGKIISQARTAKNINQKQLSILLGISPQVLNRWETNKETPNNLQIASIEKQLGVKMPRCKKIPVKDI